MIRRFMEWLRPSLVVNWVPDPDMRSDTERQIDEFLAYLKSL